MNQEAVCPCPSEKVIGTESLSFAKIPQQSRLFVQYQENPLSLQKYYPNAIESHTQISKRIPDVLKNYKVDRNALCDVLLEMNGGCSGSAKTLENIKLLRQSETVAVVSGQQAGLFTGPLYTIYKALSAVKLTECLRGRGFKAVPVFGLRPKTTIFSKFQTPLSLTETVIYRNSKTNRSVVTIIFRLVTSKLMIRSNKRLMNFFRNYHIPNLLTNCAK